MSRSPIQDGSDGAILTVHVQPKASKTEYVGLQGEALKFRVAALPADGAANEELCRCLAELFELPKSAIEVPTGHASRHKRLRLAGVSVRQARKVLGL